MRWRHYNFCSLENLENPHSKPLPMCWQCYPSLIISEKICCSLNKDHVSTVVWDIPLWCSQLFLIFMGWCVSLLQIQSTCSPVTRTRRMPYILWTVNKSVNWFFCSQNPATTGISRHSNLDSCLKISLF